MKQIIYYYLKKRERKTNSFLLFCKNRLFFKKKKKLIKYFKNLYLKHFINYNQYCKVNFKSELIINYVKQ